MVSNLFFIRNKNYKFSVGHDFIEFQTIPKMWNLKGIMRHLKYFQGKFPPTYTELGTYLYEMSPHSLKILRKHKVIDFYNNPDNNHLKIELEKEREETKNTLRRLFEFSPSRDKILELYPNLFQQIEEL